MCGIFGVWGVPRAAEAVAIGLHNLQHRATDYAGIVSTDGEYFYTEHGAGIARRVFKQGVTEHLHGQSAIGHIRYPTVTDDKNCVNIQPIVGNYGGKPVAIAHNGNITNVEKLRKIDALAMTKRSTSMDTEYILRILESRKSGNIVKDCLKVCSMLEGSFSLLILLPDCLIAIRDQHGNRPLSIGELDHGGFCVSSETCAFPSVNATHLCDVEAGTMAVIDGNGLRMYGFAKAEERKCRFEGIYYAHPASVVFGENVARFRMQIGRTLAELFPVLDADIVVPVPDSANCIAMGYAESGCSGMYFPAIMRNHYVGRTFIAPTQGERDMKVAQKFTFAAEEIRGKVIVLIDDSIVRGTTLPRITDKLRKLGAKEIHVRIGSPPISHPCRYGINTPTYDELVAAHSTIEEIRASIGADSLEFLPLEALQGLSGNPRQYCYACMSGQYW